MHEESMTSCKLKENCVTLHCGRYLVQNILLSLIILNLNVSSCEYGLNGHFAYYVR